VSAIVGKKLGMTQVFTEDGTSVPVTVIETQPNKVTPPGERTAMTSARRDPVLTS
jgi:ribosomal protein L3